MIVFLVDGENHEEFAPRFAQTFPRLHDRFKVTDYAALAGLDSLPLATYVFFDLYHAPPGRQKLAGELSKLLQDRGAHVLGSFEEDHRRPNGTETPFVLRAETPDSIAESHRIEFKEDGEDTYCDWILQGTSPEVIRSWPCPLQVDSDGNFRCFSFLRVSNDLLPLPTAISRDWPIVAESARLEPGPIKAPLELTENFGSPRIERIEYWLEDGQVRWWRIEDSAACLFRFPLLPDSTRQEAERRLMELDQNVREETPIPIQWRCRWLR